MPKKRKKQKPSFKQRQTQKARKRNINLKQSEVIRGAVATAVSKVRMTRDEQDRETADQIRGYSLEIKGTLTEMEDTLRKFTPAPAIAEAVSKPGISLTEAAKGVKSAGMDALTKVLGFMALLGVILSDKARAFLWGFFEGFLESLGLSKERIEKFKTYAKIAAVLLVSYLGVKALSAVGDLFTSVINLAKVTMGMLIASDTEVGRSMSEARKRKEAADKLKKEAKRAKAKARLERIKNRKKGIGTFALRIFGKVGRGLLSALPIVGSGIVLAYTVWDIAEELNNYYKEKYEDYDLLEDEDIEELKKEGWTNEEIVAEQQQIIKNRAELADKAIGAEKTISEGGRSYEQAQMATAMSEGMTSPESIRERDVELAQETVEKAKAFNIDPAEAKNKDVKTAEIKITGGDQLKKLQHDVEAARDKEIRSYGSNPADLTEWNKKRQAMRQRPLVINNNTNLIVVNPAQ